MFNRMMISFATALALAGSTLAQTPEETPQPTPIQPPPEASAPEPEPAPGPAPAAETEQQPEPRPSLRFWVTGDLMYGWFSGDTLPTLVTTSPVGTARGVAGVLGAASTNTLFGNRVVNGDLRAGLHLGAGYWLNDEHTSGIEAGFMMLESQAAIFAASSTATPILARPFFNLGTGRADVSLIAFPGNSTGSVYVRAESNNFYEAHLDYSESICNAGWFRLDALVGYRFYRNDEGLRIRGTSLPTNGNFVAGTQLVTEDDFNTTNEFHGGELGVRTQFNRGDFELGLLSKVAVGVVYRDVNIAGNQLVTVPGVAPVNQLGGVYALSSNSGPHSSSDWTTMPEFGANLSWRANANTRVNLGYSVFGLDQIARAADQVDTTINPVLLPPAGPLTGQNRPAFNLSRSDMWVQTLNLGLEFHY